MKIKDNFIVGMIITAGVFLCILLFLNFGQNLNSTSAAIKCKGNACLSPAQQKALKEKQKRNAFIIKMKKLKAVKYSIKKPINLQYKEIPKNIQNLIDTRNNKMNAQAVTSESGTVANLTGDMNANCDGTIDRTGVAMAAWGWPNLFTGNTQLGTPSITISLNDIGKDVKFTLNGREYCRKLVNTSYSNPAYWGGTWAKVNYLPDDNVPIWSTGNLNIYKTTKSVNYIGDYFIKYANDSKNANIIGIRFSPNTYPFKDTYNSKELVLSFDSYSDTTQSKNMNNAYVEITERIGCFDGWKMCWYYINDTYGALKANSGDLEGNMASLLTDTCEVKDIKYFGEGIYPSSSRSGRIAFSKYVPNPGAVSGKYEIFTMNAFDTFSQCLTCGRYELKNTGNKLQPSWSPDGAYLLFTAEKLYDYSTSTSTDSAQILNSSFNNNIWMIKVDPTIGSSSSIFQLTDNPQNISLKDVYFDKIDNNTIYYTESNTDHIWNIKTARIYYTNLTKPILSPLLTIMPPQGYILNDFYGPFNGGKSILSGYTKTNNQLLINDFWPNLYSQEVYSTTLNLKQITKSNIVNTINYNASVSPANTKIAYVIGHEASSAIFGGQEDIYLINPDGTSNKQLTHFWTNGYPEADKLQLGKFKGMTWGPDGNYIIFGNHLESNDSSYATVYDKMYKINLKGSCGWYYAMPTN